MTIDYDTLTAEDLEEYVEFIDWTLVSPKLITDEVKKSFGSMPQLNFRIWFEDFMINMDIKEDQGSFSNEYFFFSKDIFCMELDLEDRFLWITNRMWVIIRNKFNKYYYQEIEKNIKNLLTIHFKNIEVKSSGLDASYKSQIENVFKNVPPIDPDDFRAFWFNIK